MNFFKRKDAFKIDTGVASGSGQHSAAEPVEPPSSEPTELGKWVDARPEFDQAPIVESDDTPDLLPAHGLRDDEPDPDKDPLAEVDPEEADLEAKPNPFEARLASLRQQLQEGRRLIPEISVEVEAEAECVKEPELPELARAFAPEPPSEMPFLGLAQEPAPVVVAEDEAPSVVADAEAEMPTVPIVPEPIIAPAGRRAGRVKTRLLGFERGVSSSNDPLGSAAKAESSGRFPVGWIVVVKGPGRGASFCLYNGLSQIGRGSDQTVCLDFGDTSISRENHAVVAYDAEQKKHFLGHGGKANIVRLNDMPVLSTETLSHGDQIRIGETTLRFAALCGADFDWSMSATDDDFDAAAL